MSEQAAPQMNPVSWFEIPVADMNRAKTFYETILSIELTINEMEHATLALFPMVSPMAPGATGALIAADQCAPSMAGSTVYFTVPEIDKALETIGEAGGETIVPRFSIGEHGFIAQFKDSEGNRVALYEPPANMPEC